jgi:hypothetical protein
MGGVVEQGVEADGALLVRELPRPRRSLTPVFDGRHRHTCEAKTRMPDTAAELLEAHYVRLTGCEGESFQVSDSPPAVFAVLHRGFPRNGASAGFTFGLSNSHSPATEGHPHRELVVCMAGEDSSWVLAVAYLAVQLRGRCGFDRGDTINFRAEIASGSRMSAFLVAHPLAFNRTDAEVDIGIRHVSLRQLVPLYEEERAWLMSGGDEQLLMDRFSVDELMNPQRPPLQT